MKKCSKCNETKDLTKFTRSKKNVGYNTRPDNYHAYCKTCNAELARIRRKKWWSKTKKVFQN